VDGSLFFLGKLSRQWATKDTDPGVEKSHATDAHWRKPLATELDVKLLKDEFDLDADVVRRVERVKALTDMIVRYDRKKSGKASEGRRQSKCIYTLRCHY